MYSLEFSPIQNKVNEPELKDFFKIFATDEVTMAPCV